MRPGIIFDFDGVLVDSFHALYTLVRDAFLLLGITLTEEQYQNFFQENVKLAEKKLSGSEERFKKLQTFIQNNAGEYYKMVSLFPFAKDIILSLAEFGELAIVSSTTQNVIELKLSEQELLPYFRIISSASKEASKKERMIDVCKRLNFPEGNTFFISDTVGDIHEGRELGFKTIAVAWGFHSKKILHDAKPSFIVDNAVELIKTISQK